MAYYRGMKRTARLLIALSLCALAAACATAPDATDAANLYSCARGKSFTAAYHLSGKTATVSAGGLTRTLNLARSGSGARYTARGVELWGKGTGATLTGFPGGPYDGCATR